MGNYSSLNDICLQKLAASGDRLAEEQLAMRYSRLVKICARPYFLAGGDSEDLTQEGMLGLLSAIREFDNGISTSFKAFAELCIKRRLLTAIKNASRMKHTPLNDGLSLEEILSNEAQTHAAFLPEVFRRIPEEQVLARESVKEIILTYTRFLSQFEADILSLYLDGLSYKEMAEYVGRSQKSVDNAIQRIRRKLARCLNLGDISIS
jgi:RNA polymerase sporulation-specific sigma factor